MKIMKTFKLFSMAVLALLMAACSSSDNEILQSAQPQGKMFFSATIAAPNSGATRTIYNETSDGYINVSWKEGDKIALVHKGFKEEVTVGTPNPDGSAPISGYITPGADDEEVVLVYPADIVESVMPGEMLYFYDDNTIAKLRSQDGTLAFIQNNFDYRQGNGNLAVSGDPATASLKSSVSMPSRIAIWKLTLQDDATPNPNALAATAVSIKAGDNTLVAATSTAKSEYYLCILPGSLGNGNLTFEATVGSDTYTYSKDGVSLREGKFYQSTLTMTKQAPAAIALDITSPAKGQVIGNDGKNYDVNSVPGGVTAVAVITYVSGNHGLALALDDEGSMEWSTAMTTAAAHTPTFTGGTWRLATMDEWKQMLKVVEGGEGYYESDDLNGLITNAGGTSLKNDDDVDYWTGTEDEDNSTTAYCITIDPWDEAVFFTSAKSNPKIVRACLAF